LITLQNVVRAFLAKRRTVKGRALLPTVVQATVLRAEGLSCSESAEVGAIYSGAVLDVAPDHPFLYRDHLYVPWSSFARRIALHRTTRWTASKTSKPD
jgi:hypothetical protein